MTDQQHKETVSEIAFQVLLIGGFLTVVLGGIAYAYTLMLQF